MVGASGPVKKFDLTTSTFIAATANGLWPHATDLSRWPQWFRDARGHGLQSVSTLPHKPGIIDPLQPELGQRYHFTFTNGLEGDFQVTYWLEPAQISVGLVRDTRRNGKGLDGMIIDLDLFPRGDTTQLWFGALVLMEPGVRPSMLARWPKREVQAWVDGFHARFGEQGPALAKGIRTRKEAEAALAGAKS